MGATGFGVWKPYRDEQYMLIVVKPYQTRPAGVSTSKSAGFCIVCSAVATTEALFQLEDAVVIQRFCDKHISEANYDLRKN